VDNRNRPARCASRQFIAQPRPRHKHQHPLGVVEFQHNNARERTPSLSRAYRLQNLVILNEAKDPHLHPNAAWVPRQSAHCELQTELVILSEAKDPLLNRNAAWVPRQSAHCELQTELVILNEVKDPLLHPNAAWVPRQSAHCEPQTELVILNEVKDPLLARVPPIKRCPSREHAKCIILKTP